jgi:hypothetical protein
VYLYNVLKIIILAVSWIICVHYWHYCHWYVVGWRDVFHIIDNRLTFTLIQTTMRFNQISKNILVLSVLDNITNVFVHFPVCTIETYNFVYIILSCVFLHLHTILYSQKLDQLPHFPSENPGYQCKQKVNWSWNEC